MFRDMVFPAVTAVTRVTSSRYYSAVAMEHNKNEKADGVESAYAWTRLWIALALSTIGGVGMWSVVVALPAVQAEFGVARADASLPYTLTMIGFGIGGIVLGKLSDRFGIVPPVLIGAV